VTVLELLRDHTLQVVAAGAGVLGLTAGALGSFAVLRRQSLLGDALSHAALPGIVLAFLLTGSKAPLTLMLGAAAAGWLGTVAVGAVVRRSRLPYDSALGMLLSVFFGFGLVLLTVLAKRPDAAQAGLKTFLFGQAAALLRRDVATMAVLAAITLLLLLAAWKELKLLACDAPFGESLGLAMGRAEALLRVLLVVAIVIGLQTVGVVLMAAMLVAPAVAARQWTGRLGPMVALAGALGAAGGVAGAVLSSMVPRLPTGPTVVLILSVAVATSLVLAPHRGLLWRWLRQRRTRRAPHLDPLLMHLYALSLQHPDDPEHGHRLGVLRTMSPREVDVPAALEALAARGLAQRVGEGLWAPTWLGRREAEKALQREENADVR
jgi:manganese/zinc/iron transport system permease protein